MNNLSYPATDINRWRIILITVQNLLELILSCSLCAFSGAFEFLAVKRRQIYDLDDSAYDSSNVLTMSIKSDTIDILVMRCPICGNHFYVFPSFITKGTTLTLRAILFIAMVYESGQITWRGLAGTLGANESIAHSVLYMGVHALGKTIEDSQEMQRLMCLYPEIFPQTEEVEEIWPPKKSIKENTKKRELGVRRVLTGLYQTFCKTNTLFKTYFDKLQEKVAGIFTDFGITLATLYPLAPSQS